MATLTTGLAGAGLLALLNALRHGISTRGTPAATLRATSATTASAVAAAAASSRSAARTRRRSNAVARFTNRLQSFGGLHQDVARALDRLSVLRINFLTGAVQVGSQSLELMSNAVLESLAEILRLVLVLLVFQLRFGSVVLVFVLLLYLCSIRAAMMSTTTMGSSTALTKSPMVVAHRAVPERR